MGEPANVAALISERNYKIASVYCYGDVLIFTNSSWQPFISGLITDVS